MAAFIVRRRAAKAKAFALLFGYGSLFCASGVVTFFQ
jgi:hypothetical protein